MASNYCKASDTAYCWLRLGQRLIKFCVFLDILGIVSFATAVRLNEIQLLGTHNSFKRFPRPDLELIRSADPRLGVVLDSNAYGHPRIEDQLEQHSVRCLEFDVYDDQSGGKFVPRGVRAVLGLADELFDDSPNMARSGFKVMHIDNIDYETQCQTLQECLGIVKEWSDRNPSHIPLLIRVEMKLETMIEVIERVDSEGAARLNAQLATAAEEIPGMPSAFPVTDPPITVDTTRALVEEIDSILSREKLVTPDDLRGDFESLGQALSTQGPEDFWPDIESIRGRIIVILGGVGGEVVQIYGSSLAGSPVFTRSYLQPSTEASQEVEIPADVVFVDHAIAGTSPMLPALLSQGFFVTANADLLGLEARNLDFSNYDEIVADGAQVILTEHLRDPENSEDSVYFAELPCTGADYCVLPSNATGPPRQPPPLQSVSTEAGGAELQPVPDLVEPLLPEGFITNSASSICSISPLLGLLASLPTIASILWN